MNFITDSMRDTKRSKKYNSILNKMNNADGIIITHLLLKNTERNKPLPKQYDPSRSQLLAYQPLQRHNTEPLRINVPYRKRTDGNQQQKVDISAPKKNISISTRLHKSDVKRSTKSIFATTEAKECSKHLTNSLTPSMAANNTKSNHNIKGSIIAKDQSLRKNPNMKSFSRVTPQYKLRTSYSKGSFNSAAKININRKYSKQLTNSLTPNMAANNTKSNHNKRGSIIAKDQSPRKNTNMKSFSTATPRHKLRSSYSKGSFNSAAIINKTRKTITTMKSINTTVPDLNSTKKRTNEVTLPKKTITLSKPQKTLAIGHTKRDNIAVGLPKSTNGGMCLYNVQDTGFTARMEKARTKPKMPVYSFDPRPPRLTTIYNTTNTISLISEQKLKDVLGTDKTQKNVTPNINDKQQPAVNHILKSFSTTARLQNRVTNKNVKDADIISVEESSTDFTHKYSENIISINSLPKPNTSVNLKSLSIAMEPLKSDTINIKIIGPVLKGHKASSDDKTKTQSRESSLKIKSDIIANLKRKDSERNLLLRHSVGTTNMHKSEETSTTVIDLQQQSTRDNTTHNKNILWIKKPDGKFTSASTSSNNSSLKNESAANTQAEGPPTKKDNIVEIKKAKPVPIRNFKWKGLTKGSNNPKSGDPAQQKSKKLKVSPNLMEIICDGGLKIKPQQNIRNVVIEYFAEYPSVIVDLISVIDEIRHLPVFLSAVRCLHQLLILSHLQESGEIFNVMDYIKPVNFAVLVNSTRTLPNRFSRDPKFKEVSVKLYTRLLKVINAMCKNSQCQIQIRKINPETLQFLCNLLKEQVSKEMVIYLLDTFKLVCGAKRNCRFLSFKEFYDSLWASYKLTQKLTPAINILKLMARSKRALKYMGQQEKIINLLLNTINYHDKEPFSRCAATNVLHRLADSGKGLEILFKNENYAKLYSCFAKCKEEDEHHCRMKIYSILNRFKNTTLLLNTKLNVDLGLSDNVMHNLNAEMLSSKEESGSDGESEDESSDENYGDDSYSSHDLSNSAGMAQQSQTVDIIPLSSMQKYFVEYFPNKANLSKLSMFEPSDVLLNSSIIKLRVKRSFNLGGLAFPDAAMLRPYSDEHTITVPEFPLTYLTQKLRTIQAPIIKPTFMPKTVFHLDELYLKARDVPLPRPNSYKPPSSRDLPVGDSLQFESRFECGNLRRAIQVEKYDYNLILSPDTLTMKGFQWFYFQVSNMLAGVEYTFNIINFTKEKNAYNEGMLPVMFSAADYQLNGNSWRRVGNNVIFHGNHYTNKTNSVQYRSLTFSIKFTFSCDYVYIAYHYPYTYTRLMVTLYPCSNFKSTRIYTRLDKLCDTVNNRNEVPLLTITAPDLSFIPLCKRPIIILTARVHPGETNASWIMEGIIKYLLNETNPDAALAREYYVFKIIPMLNPEGVIYGNTRCGLTGNDLNRCWSKPNVILYPEIFYTKKLIEYAKTENGIPIAAYIDIHGHSNKKYFFFYGCNPKQSWNTRDCQKGDWLDVLEILPKAIQAINPNIQLSQCNYDITKSKEKTSRVVMWRELGITQSYTLECSYSEACKKQSINTKLLTDIGESVVSAMGRIADELYKSKQSLPSFGLDYSNMNSWDLQPSSHGDNSCNEPVQSTSANAFTTHPVQPVKHVPYYFSI